MSPAPNLRYVRIAGIPSVDLEGETVLLGLERQSYFGLKNVAKRVWDLLQAPRTLAELCLQLGSEFEVTEATCQAEVAAFLARLEAEKLVQVTS